MLVIHLLVAIVTLMIFATIINIIIICCWPWLVLMLRVYLHHCMTIMIVMIMTMITTISNDYHWVLLSRLQDSLDDLGSHILMQFFWTISFSFASLETAKRMACTHSVVHVLIHSTSDTSVIEDQGSSRFVLPFHGNSQSFWRRSKEVRRGLQATGQRWIRSCMCPNSCCFFVWWLVSLHGWRVVVLIASIDSSCMV